MTWGFKQFNNWAERHLKLDLHSYKEKQLQRRINTIMTRSGAVSLREYSELITQDAVIKQDFFDYITINVTDFFRNENLFDEFEKLLIEELHPEFGRLKIWSAACSIGSEPYSLAIIMENQRIPLDGKILATDIDDKILERAREGIYNENELKNLSNQMMNQYFVKEGKKYHLKPKIKDYVRFSKHDLLLDPYERNVHVIVCRNVMIYFKEEAKNEIYRKFSESLVTGGVIFTGATESIHDPGQYGLEKAGSFMYRKI